MAGDVWHVRGEFRTINPSESLAHFWEDDERNRQRSLETFSKEAALVDEGLTLFVDALQGAFRSKENWESSIQLRASIAMLIHSFNVFLSWRHLLTLGYLAEARLFVRSIHESLSRAVVFSADESFAERFYAGEVIWPREIRDKFSNVVTASEANAQEILKELRDHYARLSKRAHPTLNSFSLRTPAQEIGNPGLAGAVPDNVMMGWLLSDDVGRLSWIELAKNLITALHMLRQIVKEGTGGWDAEYVAYEQKVRCVIAENVRD